MPVLSADHLKITAGDEVVFDEKHSVETIEILLAGKMTGGGCLQILPVLYNRPTFQAVVAKFVGK